MGMKKWVVAEFDKTLAKRLADECETDPIVALIASARGYDDEMALEQFISDEPYFTDPWEMTDISLAANILNEAVSDGKKIAVYGDYDCDGVTATALMYNYLKSRAADCVYYIPDRFTEGYGMNCDAVKKLAAEGVNLIVTVDNGIVCDEEINLAHSLGMKVIVTDHHLPSEILPDADAVVNPHRRDCLSEFKNICGAQVAFRLICVCEDKEPEELIPYFADLLSLAVIADIMPLTLENRSIVKCGIEKMKTAPIKGISALMSVAGIQQNSIDASKIAFTLCPRINAAGRMGDAKRAVELLCTDNMMKALSLANEIDEENGRRQQEEKAIFKEAVEIIEENDLKYHRVIVVAGENWHHGIVGIVASKIVEKYGKPAILVSSDGEVAVGSGRSIEGFSLYDAIDYCRDLLVKFGGHEQAAGVTVKTENIEDFRIKINEYASHFDYVAPVLRLDCKLNPSALSLDLTESLKVLEPYGTGNKVPVFGVFGVTLSRITPIAGGKHLRLIFTKGNNSFQALLFGITPDAFCFCEGDMLDLAVTVDENSYKGNTTVSVMVKAIRMSGTDDVKLFQDMASLDDYFTGAEFDVATITPTREDVGKVYKFITAKPVLKERIVYVFLNELGFAKTNIALKVLEELGLATNGKNGFISGVRSQEKTNLLNSKIYRDLTERSGKND